MNICSELTETQRHKLLLDSQHEWPCEYGFKFIVPTTELQNLRALFTAGETMSERPSKGGKYTSLTLKTTVDSSDAVLEIYDRVRCIPGIMAF